MSWDAIQDCKDLFHEIFGFLYLNEIMETSMTSKSWKKQMIGCRIWGAGCESVEYMENVHTIYGFRYMTLYCHHEDITSNELKTVFAELRTLSMYPESKLIINPGSLPTSITHLELKREFAQIPVPGSFHSGIVHLEFHNLFDHSLKNLLPNTLTYLYTGSYFNQPIESGTLPESLIHLKFDNKFNQKLVPGSFPGKLQKLIFGVFQY
jgi:FNIP Repeat